MPTGPGGLDANGVWQYGEDDTEALASDLLNLGMASVSTEVGLLDAAVAAIVTGQILQVVSTAKTDTFTMSSTTYADVTGLSVSITPSSSSNKILVLANVSLGQTTEDAGANLQLVRDSTPIFIGDAAGDRVRASYGTRYPNGSSVQDLESPSPVFLDPPATTSSVTYKVQVRSGNSGAVAVNRTGSDDNAADFSRSASSITVMEVAG